ncbi:hypothetical protein F2P81_018305 [Scophthalmus maximus]|uniref:Uncharacterized protein n=1 Tax=Scophthalmus maximus TaxID=52904 RepID=A0A6A4SBV0_SCOMX|nr:hypothetical protein F2P81_018305 [Scophthalmus maximus]
MLLLMLLTPNRTNTDQISTMSKLESFRFVVTRRQKTTNATLALRHVVPMSYGLFSVIWQTRSNHRFGLLPRIVLKRVNKDADKSQVGVCRECVEGKREDQKRGDDDDDDDDDGE